MITKVATSIVKKNLSVFSCMNKINTIQVINYFSDNNKKNPFQKFKRTNNTPKNQQKKQEKSQAKHQENQKQKKQNINLSSRESINQFNQRPKEDKDQSSKTGFGKFRRNVNYDKILKSAPKNQSKQTQKSQEDQKVTNSISKNQPEQIKNDKEQKTKVTQNLKVKGFQKFKKVQTQQKTQESRLKTKLQNQNKENIDKEKDKKIDQKSEPILNSKTPEQIQRQNSYKNTQNKIQDDKQEWQGFLQDQIKKEKQKKNKSQQGQWKNFDFTSRKKAGESSKNQNGQQKKPPLFKAPKTPLQFMKILFLGGVGVYLISLAISEIYSIDGSKDIQTDEMINLLKQGRVRQTWFLTTVQSLSQQSSRTKKYACVTLDNGQVCKCESNNDFQNSWNKTIMQYNQTMAMMGINQFVNQKPPIVKKDNHIFNSVRSILSFALLFLFLKSIMSGVSKGKGQMGGKGGLSGLFQNTKSNRFRQNINVKFDDVVGMNKAKQEIVEFIDFLKNAQKYNKLGAKIPRGALLTGPPGTGKTMLAKACAGESGVPFYTISGSQFMQMYVGVGAQRVRNLFAEAKQTAPSIIFIDEIDAVGKKRTSGSGGGGNDQRDNTLNQLLVQMDGFDQTTNVIVFAATNQKQVLDPALTRPGRFDRLIQVDLPDIEGRKQIFMVHLKPITLDQKYAIQQYAKRLATLTPGFSGADIKNLCNQAAIIAARGDKKHVSMIDFQLASQRIIGGVQKKSTLITPETKKTVAYHECGHGVVSWFMQHASPLLKLTIIPRSKGALGFAQYLPNESQVYTIKQLQDQICVILGGRVAQQIFFKKISTGASDDLQKAHKVAKAIIAEYGMGKDLGWLSFTETQYAKQYSHMTEQKIDKQILQLIYDCSIKTRQIINQKKDKIQALAQLLLKQQTIDQRMIQQILGERPFKSSKQYEDYIREKKKMDEDDIKKEIEEAVPVSSIKTLQKQNSSTKFAIVQAN